jgi:hypothetical protein
MSSIIETLCASSQQNQLLKKKKEINEKKENSVGKLVKNDKITPVQKIIRPQSSALNNNSKSKQSLKEKSDPNKEKSVILKKNDIVNLPPKKEIKNLHKKEGKEVKKESLNKIEKPVQKTQTNHSNSSKEKTKPLVLSDKEKTGKIELKAKTVINNPIVSENDKILNELKNIQFEDLMQMDNDTKNKYMKLLNQKHQDKIKEDHKQEKVDKIESQHLNKKRQRPNNHIELDSKVERPKEKKQEIKKNESKTDPKLIHKELVPKRPLNLEKKKIIETKAKALDDKLPPKKDEHTKQIVKDTDNKTFKQPNQLNKNLKTESKTTLDVKEKIPIKSSPIQGNNESNKQKTLKPTQSNPNLNINKHKNPEENKASLSSTIKQELKKPESKPLTKIGTNSTAGNVIKAAFTNPNSSSVSKQSSNINASQKNLPTKLTVNNSSSVEKNSSQVHPPEKKVNMNKKYNKSTRAIFEMGDDLDSFICDDDEEDSSTKGQNWKKEIDKIKKKYHRNPTYMDHDVDEDIMEAQFSEIEQEESNALRIAEEEDEREELREKLFYSKKKK